MRAAPRWSAPVTPGVGRPGPGCVDSAQLGRDRPRPQCPGLPPGLPSHRQRPRRGRSDPGRLRPRLPFPAPLPARHLRGLAAPDHHQPLPGRGPATQEDPLRRSGGRLGRPPAEPVPDPVGAARRRRAGPRRGRRLVRALAGVPGGRRALRHRGSDLRRDLGGAGRQDRHRTQPHPPRPGPAAPALWLTASRLRTGNGTWGVTVEAGQSGARGVGVIVPPCADLAPLRSAFVDGALGPADRDRLLNHLAGCASCRQDVADLRAVRRLVGGTFGTGDPAPEDLAARLLSIAQPSSCRPAAAGGGACGRVRRSPAPRPVRWCSWSGSSDGSRRRPGRRPSPTPQPKPRRSSPRRSVTRPSGPDALTAAMLADPITLTSGQPRERNRAHARPGDCAGRRGGRRDPAAGRGGRRHDQLRGRADVCGLRDETAL